MNIAVIGTGYVGLVSGVCLASKGHLVTCVDLRPDVIDQLNHGVPHIYENGLEELLQSVVERGLFKATTNIRVALERADVVLIAVGTPSSDGEIDLSQVQRAAKQIGQYIKDTDRFISIIVKSTVIPGTTDFFVYKTLCEHSGKDGSSFGLGMNPEFLREGNAIEDFMTPDRIVIGYQDHITRERLKEMYSPWDCDKIYVNTRTAEMIKYVNNTVLATIISMNNELANLATSLGSIDYNEVVQGVISDKRWSPILENGARITPQIATYFTPGVGFGGSCFPKDVEAIRTQGGKAGLKMPVTNATLFLNMNQALYNVDILESRFGILKGRNILLLGLAFKPETDDVRESSAIRLLKLFQAKGALVTAHDPIAIRHARKELTNPEFVTFKEDWKTDVSWADIIVIGTNWAEYKQMKQFNDEGILANKIVFDSKRLFTISDLDRCKYFTVGYSKESNSELLNNIFNSK